MAKFLKVGRYLIEAEHIVAVIPGHQYRVPQGEDPVKGKRTFVYMSTNQGSETVSAIELSGEDAEAMEWYADTYLNGGATDIVKLHKVAKAQKEIREGITAKTTEE